jgi:phenylacetate-CoA ligase
MAHSLERFYPYMPAWAQNVGISVYGLSYRRERLGGDFERYVAGFRERDRWSKEQMQAYVDQQLRHVLMHAFERVPYYQKSFKKTGVTRLDLTRMTAADLPKLPVTPKSDLRSMPDAFVADNVAAQQKLHRYHSSGSTGTPVTAICTSDGHRRFIAAREARSFGWAGSSVRRPRSMIGGRLVVPKGVAQPPFHRYNWAERQVYFSAYHIAPAHVGEYVQAFNHHRPKLLTGYAYSHYLLARMMCEQSVSLDYEPEAVVLSSEKLTPEMKRVIRQAFRARAYEEYGAVENCVLATECEHGNLHVSPDFGVLELVDQDGHPVPPGIEGRILCTSLLNEAQPLIRYEVGDVGIWSPKSCPCGRNHLPVLQEIVGRLEDVVIGPDGREMVRFHGVFIDLPHVLEGQVIQETLTRFRVKVVPQGDFGAEDEKLIRRRFVQRLGPVGVEIEKVVAIPRTERGKFRAVICSLSPEEKTRARSARVMEAVAQ